MPIFAFFFILSIFFYENINIVRVNPRKAWPGYDLKRGDAGRLVSLEASHQTGESSTRMNRKGNLRN